MIDKSALEYLREHVTGCELVTTDRLPENYPSPVVAIPKDTRLESLEAFQHAPNRIKQTAQLKSCGSFCDYVNRFKDADSSIYLDVDAGKFLAVLDHHGANNPRWTGHKAVFAPQLSIPWRAWNEIHKTPLSQLALAHFIEERLDDIVEPEPNVMLQAALDFQANENLTLASSANLDNGALAFTFKKGDAAKKVVFPHRLRLAIPIHANEAPVTLEGRMRYKVDGDGALRFTFSFVKNPEQVVRDALLALSATILERTEGLPHYEGAL